MRRPAPSLVPALAASAVAAALALALAPSAPASPDAGKPGEPTASPASSDAERRALDAEKRLDTVVRPFLTKHCFECHGKGEAEKGVALDAYPDLASVVKDRKTWRKVAEEVRRGDMPPAEKPRIEEAERVALLAWIDDALAAVDCGAGPADPGRTTVRRLNRFEYDRTMRDLLGVDVRAAERFPADDRGYGFDNNADVLTVSPLLVEKYLAAAEKAIGAAVVLGDPLARKTEKAEGAYLEETGGVSPRGTSPRGMFSNGSLVWRRTIGCAAEYVVRVRASGDQAGPDLPRLSVQVDDREVASVDVDAPRNAAKVYERRVRLEPGERRLAFAFVNDWYRKGAGKDGSNLDRNLYIERIELDGPIGATASALPEPHRRIFFVAPDRKVTEAEAARRIVQRFASRAFRRPVADDETARYTALFKAGRARKLPFEEAMLPALEAVLVSPHFLYRVEREPRGLASGEAYDVPSIEMASRLSYFLWSSMPDQALQDEAQAGRLATATALEAQAARMLRDPRADALVQGFAAQWLELGALDASAPDPKTFPEASLELKASMRRETELFLEGIVREDRSILELIDSDYIWVDETMARHYGIEGVAGSEWRRVPSKGTGRGGVIAQASILTLTSRPTRTSPVLRGRWLLDEVLDAPPSPAPPGVPPLDDGAEAVKARSLRDRMARHRTDPACASCHARMDALGFALEAYDGLGMWREKDGAFPVDDVGELPDGTKVRGLDGLKRWLLERRQEFARAFARRLLTWALGRGVEAEGDDRCALDEIARRLEAEGYRFSAAVKGVVSSEPFRRKRAEGGRKK